LCELGGRNNASLEIHCISKLARLQPPRSLDHSLQVHFQTRSITASEFTRSQPPGLYQTLLEYGLQVRTIMASKCITNLARLQRPSLHDRSLQVHLQTRSIAAFKYIFKEQHRVYGDTGVTEVERVMGSIYSADPGVDRHHLISISSYHTMKIHTLSVPTFGLTHSVCDVMD